MPKFPVVKMQIVKLAGYNWQEMYNVYSISFGNIIPCQISWEEGGYKIQVADLVLKRRFETAEIAAQIAVEFVKNRMAEVFASESK